VFLLVVCWYDAVAFPTVSRVNSVVSGYVLLHLRSIYDFTVKVKCLIDNFCTDRRRRLVPVKSILEVENFLPVLKFKIQSRRRVE
jgi:hypothetical protein